MTYNIARFYLYIKTFIYIYIKTKNVVIFASS